MSRRTSERWVRAAGVALVSALFALAGAPAQASGQVLLEGGSTGTILRGNDFQCGVRNDGGTCADLGDSSTDPGGFWPTGSPNAYMFNSGLMVAGIIDPASTGPWAGDTVGAFFFNASGGTVADPITNVWDSLDPDDLENWPAAGSIPQFPNLSAYVTDPDVYAPTLLGSAAASQQDSWVVYWDGNPNNTNGPRDHPAGLLIEQRSLAWNYPAGNEGTIYFIYNVHNVSNNQYFQQQNEAAFFGGANALPDEGWTLTNLYMSYAADPDVTANAGQNFATAILPFDMGIVYRSEFVAPEFVFPPAIFHPPFFTDGVGIIGTKYLQSPIIPGTDEELGLTLFSVYTNGGTFSDPGGSAQLFRYLSGDIRPDLGDDSCRLPNPIERRVCYIAPSEADVRYYQASGPFSLAPGESTTIVSAMFAAATYAGTGNGGEPTITQGVDNPPTVNANTPGLAPDCNGAVIAPIEVAAGWLNTNVCPAPGEAVNIFDVETVPESLLFKAQVAQTIFDNNFLLPFAPRQPEFTLVPGDDQVTVIWEPSPSEETGDPFADAAADETSALYNPNFRRFDVEGYRIYRSTDNTNFTLIAQFDKAGTTFEDYLCETDATVPAGECPDDSFTSVPISGDFIQYPSGGVIETSQGNILVVEADTVQDLQDTGIPYVYVDDDVRNGFQYFYRVTAFDVNSLRSGPASLESTAETKSTIPQPLAAGVVDSVEAEVTILLGNGQVADVSANEQIDPVTGRFAGPPPPTDAFSGTFASVFAPLLDASGQSTVAMTLDSIVPAYIYTGTYYFSDNSGQIFTIGPVQPANASGATDGIAGPAAVPADPEKADSLEEEGVDVPAVAGQVFVQMHYPNTSQWHSGDADWAYLQPGFWVAVPPAGADAGGSRWFEGANETMADPTVGGEHGQLTGVTEIYVPTPYVDATASGSIHRRFNQTTMSVRRVADIEVRWGAAGTQPEVFDVTHQLPVPFSPAVRASFGFLNNANANAVLEYTDSWHIPGLEGTANIGTNAASDPEPLQPVPTIQPIDINGNLTSDGNGFAMYIAGELFFFQTAAVPTNTTWTLRTHSGAVTGGPGAYVHFHPGNEPAGVDLFRTPGVPGLRFAVQVNNVVTFDESLVDLRDIRVVPDPYYGVSLFDDSPASRNLRFMNLPPRATIRIYSVSGVLVDVINHDSPSGESLATWDLRNRSGQFIASGVYFYHVTSPQGEHTGRFTIVNSGFAQ